MILKKRLGAWIAILTASWIHAQPAEDIERVAGFARLYGVVRYFHPSDAATQIDWNRFVVFGVSEIKKSKTASDYQHALMKLFSPITHDLRIQEDKITPSQQSKQDEKPLIAWEHYGPGVHSTSGGVYLSQRINRKIAVNGFITMMQSIDAKALRGQTVRLVALARVENSTEQNGGAVWLRVDRIDGSMGFFDNMENRPIRESQWREYIIEGPVAADANNIAFGVMAEGGGITACFDHVRLSARTKEGKWEAVDIADGDFETGNGWGKSGSAAEMANVNVSDSEAPHGKHWMKISLPKEFSPQPISSTLPKRDERINISLTAGLFASLPLTLNDETAKITSVQSNVLKAIEKDMKQMPNAGSAIADVIVAWNTLRHFYPYWDVVNVDWDSRLIPLLQSAANQNMNYENHKIVLRRLLSEIKDGHAGVYDPKITIAYLPITVDLIEDQIVVIASKTDQARVGDVILKINDQPFRKWFLEARDLVSGSDAWCDSIAGQKLAYGPKDTTVNLTIEHKDDTQKTIELTYKEQKPELEKRPGEVTELNSGIWYIDLRKVSAEAINPKLSVLAKAKGVVFDLRGYPTNAVVGILSHLIAEPEQDRWMHVPVFIKPGGSAVEWNSFGWNLKPELPKISANRVFLTDGRAISYAESVMGYIKDRKLASIIGSTTAGANGNVVSVQLPSGLYFSFTGMRVTRHDGSSRFHGLGVEPDKVVKPTLAGIHAGRDEVLEAAIEYLQTTTK